MMDLERRLQHAARELRAVEIEPPPLESLGAPHRPTGIAARIPALVMPVLFVLGGFALVAGGVSRQVDDTAALPAAEITVTAPVTAPVAAVPAAGTASAAPAPALSARQEIALIAALAPAAAPAEAAEAAAPASELRTLSRRYR